MDDPVRVKLVKLLRMLTSPYDGEVLAAANRLNGMIAGHDLDWEDLLLKESVNLTEQQLRRVFEEGRRKGMEEARSDWGEAGTSRSEEVGADLNEVNRILSAMEAARGAGRKLSGFEASFLSTMRERIDSYGSRTYVSERQWQVLRSLARKFGP